VNDVALELFSSFGSKAEEVTVAMLVKVVPGAVSTGTLNTTVKSTLDPAGKGVAVHVIVPGLPFAGVMQVNALLVLFRESNVNPVGMTSVKVAVPASSGPPFVTLMLNVTVVPGAALSGPVFKTLRSLC
jgi:hypothetical protein